MGRWLRLYAALATVAAGMLAAAPASADRLEEITSRGSVEIAMYKDWVPFAYKRDGKTVGVDVDVANALAERLGVRAALRLVGADENMEDDLRNNVWKGHYLGGGVADVMLHVPVDPQFAAREDMVTFTAPYYRESLLLGADPDKVPDSAAVDVFKTHKVGVEIDTLPDFLLLSAFSGALAPNVVHFTTLADAAEALRQGEVAAIYGPAAEVEGLLSNDGRFSMRPMSVPGRSDPQWDIGAAVRFNHNTLAAAVNEAMTAMRDDGTVAAIFAEHGVKWRGPSDTGVSFAGGG